MLSEEEKKEMLEDARSSSRRESFRAGGKDKQNVSFDEYLIFLDSIQRFSSFTVSHHITHTEFNKL